MVKAAYKSTTFSRRKILFKIKNLIWNYEVPITTTYLTLLSWTKNYWNTISCQQWWKQLPMLYTEHSPTGSTIHLPRRHPRLAFRHLFPLETVPFLIRNGIWSDFWIWIRSAIEVILSETWSEIEICSGTVTWNEIWTWTVNVCPALTEMKIWNDGDINFSNYRLLYMWFFTLPLPPCCMW